MKHHAYAYLATLACMVILDGVWLWLTMEAIYRKHLSHVLAEKPLWWAVIAFYLLYAFGLYFLVVRNSAVSDTGSLNIFVSGLVFGAAAYGTYDLTNQATIKGWPKFITIIDILYGSLLSGLSALAGTWMMRF